MFKIGFVKIDKISNNYIEKFENIIFENIDKLKFSEILINFKNK